ncbi:FAD:protein FMN transferase, partial [Eubacteriales bacterium OttesenSCG-928-M02]|nr:FAD:protein FMN transferase [Eubacteriales bacterium OttesenSCG-928-M02]
MKKALIKWVPILVLLFLITGCTQQAASPQREDYTHFTMDTVITLSLYQGEDGAIAQGLFAYLDDLDGQFSITANGPVAQLNASGTATLRGEVLALTQKAFSLAKETNGAFDPTLLPLKTLWHIGDRTEEEALP